MSSSHCVFIADIVSTLYILFLLVNTFTFHSGVIAVLQASFSFAQALYFSEQEGSCQSSRWGSRQA